MITNAIIEGLTILQLYRENIYGCNVTAEHNVIFVEATETALDKQDISKMTQLGWFQGDLDTDIKFTTQDYNPLFVWQCLINKGDNDGS